MLQTLFLELPCMQVSTILQMAKTTVEMEHMMSQLNGSILPWLVQTVSGLSESEIVSQIDSMGAGLGAYSAEIGVSAEAGNCLQACMQPLR